MTAAKMKTNQKVALKKQPAKTNQLMNKIRRKMKKKAMKTMKTTKTMMIPKTLMNLLTGREKTKSVKGRKVCVSCKQWV